MAREGRPKGGGFGLGSASGHWSCKRITLTVCFVNIVVALFVLRSLYFSLYIYSNKDNVVKYTQDQIMKMEESVKIRRASEPIELIKLVKRIKRGSWSEESVAELPQTVKHKITDEILQRFRKAVESWRKEKLKEAKKLALGEDDLNSTRLQEEAGMLVKALDSNWSLLSEEIGLWIPTEINNQEHDDKPEGVEDTEDDEHILAGRPLPRECHAELHTDYDGVAVRWGLTQHKESAADCCQACLDQAKNAKPGENKCKLWVYCPSETGCYSPDKYQDKHMECWLKFSEKPRLNFKDRYSEAYRDAHPKAPVMVPWVSGITSS
ncbi:DNAJ heat shock N-terminal domain-containing protein isoform 1 [Hibiscus syriacus]|uniref:DNAJ heat shock N-terminal domain-containing protein isoform 1 n=1 Tax=Hibiscus syriacus TaxID=106335 RepID=A0A6A3BF97_HIBSY|nr:DNAJ heat shock N-terminal domain-containing protein isoform 1 [Hibiscus syriacus]